MRTREPGVFIPYENVEKMLVSPVYGATDLVELGLFHSDSCIRREIHEGKIKFQKVNTKSIIFCRDDLLSYWKLYRNKPFEPANNIMTIRMTISEFDYLNSVMNKLKLDKDSLFRKVIQELMRSKDVKEVLFGG
jgi:hypothetical protein